MPALAAGRSVEDSRYPRRDFVFDNQAHWERARALGEMGDPRAIPLLIESLHEDAARAAAMAALLRFGRAAIARLCAVLAMPHVVNGIEPPPWVDRRAAAATLLGELGDPGSINRTLDDPQRAVRLAAAMSLASRGGALPERALHARRRISCGKSSTLTCALASHGDAL
jgi:HEAT repeat protein